MCAQLPVIMTLYKPRSHNYNQQTVQPRRVTAAETDTHLYAVLTKHALPYYHTLLRRLGLHNICFLTPCRNLLALSIRSATNKTLGCQAVSVLIHV